MAGRPLRSGAASPRPRARPVLVRAPIPAAARSRTPPRTLAPSSLRQAHASGVAGVVPSGGRWVRVSASETVMSAVFSIGLPLTAHTVPSSA